MKVGVGYCDEKDAFHSGKSVVETAIEKANIDRPDLVIAFNSGRIDSEDFFRGLQSVTGKNTPVIGGSAIGVFTNDQLSYEGYATGAAVFQSDSLGFEIAVAGDLDVDERKAGTKLARNFSDRSENRLLLVFYDSVKSAPTETSPMVINASVPLVSGMENALGGETPIIGAGLFGDFEFSPTMQFCGDSVRTKSVVGCLLSGSFEPHYRTMHGCTPLDGRYHTITKMDGAVIRELDGKPAVEIIDSVYGNTDWRNQQPVRRVSIGVNTGEKFADFRENDYVTRLITGALPNGDGIMLFEPDLSENMEIQLMVRDLAHILSSARRNSEELMAYIRSEGKNPVFALYIDCVGRCAEISETETEEASEVADVLNQYGVPLLGFYSGVEVAPFMGKSRGLDWTGVLVVFTEE